ncbi:MAG: ribosome maturation factor RimM [Lachnospiraceae bacterium]|nr:ribosome maturation factor RimM [Lachnospiraceae bacterium]
MEDMLRVGVISSTHGVRGEVKVFPTTDDPARFNDLKEVTLENGKEKLVLKIQNVKFFKNMVILKFEGLDNINDIEKYKGKDLWIRRDQAVKLEEGEYFIADLIGLNVITDEGETLGVLKDVLQTGANDVYIVQMASGREVLIPVIKQCILEVNLEEGRVKVHLLPGLLDL